MAAGINPFMVLIPPTRRSVIIYDAGLHPVKHHDAWGYFHTAFDGVLTTTIVVLLRAARFLRVYQPPIDSGIEHFC
jgi:hypothetical protein